MALPTRTLGILISLFLSTGMVAASFYFSGNVGTNVAGAGTTEELLRAYASQDTDGDLLFDWQEKLYGADPLNPNSLDETMGDREAVDSGAVKPKFSSDTSVFDPVLEDASLPGTLPAKDSLTDRFAKQFFEKYLTIGGEVGVPTGDDLIAFVNEELEGVYRENTPRIPFTVDSLHTVPSGKEALLAYAVDLEEVFATITIKTEKAELEYFAEAVHSGKTSSLAKVKEIGAAYTKVADGMALLTVPEDAADAHLKTLAAFSTMGTSLEYISAYEADPLLAFVGASLYEETAKSILAGVRLYAPVFEKHSLTIEEGKPGYSLYFLLALPGVKETP